MCLSIVYIDKGAIQEEFMRDVARIEAEAEGFYFINLFGEKKFVKSAITSIDFVGQHAIVLVPIYSNHIMFAHDLCHSQIEY